MYNTVEPLTMDTLNKGQCVKYFFIKDSVFTLLYKLYIETPLIVDNLSIMDTSS